MDSGSADFWVGSEQCQSLDGGGCNNHTFLGSKSSSSFVDSGKPFAIQYGSGDVSGTIIQDNIVIAGLPISGHTFGVADLESHQFSDDTVPFDGLMGLAISKLSNQKTPTPVEALAAANLISDAIVSYKLSSVQNETNDGEITFGALDATKFDPKTLVTLPTVNQFGFWEASLDDVSVGGKSLGFQNRTAILDTGTTLAIIPVSDAQEIHALIPGSTFDALKTTFTIPCNTSTVVSFGFGGRSFDISPENLIFGKISASGQDCLSGIVAGSFSKNSNQWLLGATFLKNVYYSTDVKNNSLSLAKLV